MTQTVEATKFGVNATSDGWGSNPQHRPVEAQLLETPTLTLLNEAKDLSGMVKSNFNIAKMLKKKGLPRSTIDFMCVDGAEIGAVNMLMAGARQGETTIAPRPWLSAGVCTPHSLDLELEDIAKLRFVAQQLDEMRKVVKFVRGHYYSLFLWRERSALELLLPGDTRFATNFIIAGRLVKEQDSAKEMVADRRFDQWLEGKLEGKKTGNKIYKALGMWVKEKVNDADWWVKNETILSIVDPIIELLRLGDSELPLMGKAYHRMSLISSTLDDTEFAPGLSMRQRAEVVKVCSRHVVRARRM